MAAYAAGDLSAFDALFRRWEQHLRDFFLRSLGSASDSDDLLQATFFRVHRARAAFRPGGDFRAWLFRIAANLEKDEVRRRRRLSAAQDHVRAGLPTRNPPFGAIERDTRVRAAIARLPPSQRMVIHLNRYQQMTYAEIGAALGTSQTAVKVRASRAYRRLRRELAGGLPDESSLFPPPPPAGRQHN
jgi:RNA polymerase sigma-70 factor (ECF subfamily)